MSVTQSPSVDKLAAALVRAQGQLKGAVKDATNPFYKNTYADLASVWDACKAALQENGLSVVQFPGFVEGAPATAQLTTMLLHESGQWLQGTAGAPLAKPDAQSVGSAITYLRRYALAAVIGVVQEDDDGNSAVDRKESGRGRSSTGRTKDAPVAPPPAPLSAMPPALTAPEEPLPFDALTREQPCPLAPKNLSLAKMTRAQLKFFEGWLDAHPVAPRADEWMELTKAEIATR